MYARVIPRPPCSVERQQAQVQSLSIGPKSWANSLWRIFNVPDETMAWPKRCCELSNFSQDKIERILPRFVSATRSRTYLLPKPRSQLYPQGTPSTLSVKAIERTKMKNLLHPLHSGAYPPEAVLYTCPHFYRVSCMPSRWEVCPHTPCRTPLSLRRPRDPQ